MIDRECFTVVASYDHTMSYDFYITTYPVVTSPKTGILQAKNAKNQRLYKSTWLEAIRYCNRLSAKNNLESAYCEQTGELLQNPNTAEFLQNSGFRLPTPKEWEYAARAWTKLCGTSCTELQRKYYKIPGLDYPITPEEVETYENGYSKVGQLIANEIGIYGIVGHAREWCSVIESYRNQQNQSIHWEEYIPNYNNDIGYCVSTKECIANELNAFRVVLTRDVF